MRNCLVHRESLTSFALRIFLVDMWARIFFENGVTGLYGLGADNGMLKQIKCGYYLAVYKKTVKIQGFMLYGQAWRGNTGCWQIF